jgi:DoxX-like family
MESTLHNSVLFTTRSTPKVKTIAYWIATALFCLQMSFTAYAQLRLPQVAEAFIHLGFPSYFRVELSWAKFLGVVLLLAPVPARFKEWAYAGFAITLVSALIAHFAVGDGPEAWGWAAGTSVLWGVSYFLWRSLQPTLAIPERS